MRLIRHAGIFVDNLEKMKDFYVTHLNMRVSIHDIEVGEYISTLYGLNNQIEVELYKLITEDECMIELLKIFPENHEDTHAAQVFYGGCSHVAFTVTDVDDVYDRMTGEGIEFFSRPLLSRDKMHKVCFCKDPEGNYIEFVEDL